MAKAFTRQQRFARRLDDIHAEFVTEGGCGFEAFQQSYAGGSTGELTDAAQEIYQAALAAAPTHVPPPRTAFLEHCEVEIYEGLTYVRLDDVMHLLSDGTPSDELLQSKQNETRSKENFVSEPKEERVTQLPVRKTGDGCKCCYSTYERCTDLILRVTGRACCAQCSLTDTHNERDVT